MSDMDGYAHSLDHDFDPDDWQLMQYTDTLAWEREAEEVWKASATRPLTEDERRLLAWAMGKPNLYQQEAR